MWHHNSNGGSEHLSECQLIRFNFAYETISNLYVTDTYHVNPIVKGPAMPHISNSTSLGIEPAHAKPVTICHNLGSSMNELTLNELNDRFSIQDQLNFESGPGGFLTAVISNNHASATILLYGGHVLSYCPTRHEEVLWVSGQSLYQPGKAIRGGIPVCWPWFADHPTDPNKPAHGFVRNAMWHVLETNIVNSSQTQIQLGISDHEQTRAIWPHPFQLTITVTVGPQLSVHLAGLNNGSEPIVCGGALHTYFSIGHIDQTTIAGLENDTYIDKVDAFKQKRQDGPVRITQLTDSVYLDTTADCVIEDPMKRRRIRIAKSDSHCTVVWNPWKDKSRTMADFGIDEYQETICVEAANTANAVVTVEPGQKYRMGTRISVEPFMD